MEGLDAFAIAAGIILSVGGLALTIFAPQFPFVLIYSIPMLIIGIVILATLKKQEYIEPIKTKSLNNVKSKK